MSGYAYEFVKLYGAQCQICGYEVAMPSKKDMHALIMLHLDKQHGKSPISRMVKDVEIAESIEPLF